MDLDKEYLQNIYVLNNAFIAENENLEAFKEYAEKHNLVTIGNGIYCPKENAQQLIDQLIDFRDKYIVEDKRKNTNEQIILRELKRFNVFEDIQNLKHALQALLMYRFDVLEIEKVLNQNTQLRNDCTN